MKDTKEYIYYGPVYQFDRCIADHWEAMTYAPSEKKARSNFSYQYKREYDLAPTARIDLPGTISVVE